MLVDDHASFRQPLAFMIDREADLSVVAEAGSLAEARSRLASREIDIAVVDIDLPDGSGLDFVSDVNREFPEAGVIVLSASVDPHHRARAIEAGAAGVLPKSGAIADVIAAIRRLWAGEALIPAAEMIAFLREASRHRARQAEAGQALNRLTPREHEVLQALADGLSDKEIAERLHVGPKTVRTHTANMLGKLGVDSRLLALVLAARHGVIRFD
jgi:DNA-binding NarL/FixJ family response regulator